MRLRLALLIVLVLFATPAMSQAGDEDFQAINTDSFFGAVTHFLATPPFFDDGDAYWTPERIVPVLKELGARTTTFGLFAYDSPPRRVLVSANGILSADALQRRKVIDSWLSLLDKEQFAVMMGIIAKPPLNDHNKAINGEFADWLAALVKRHPSIKFVQLHNEPNTPPFNRVATPRDYVEMYRPIARQIKMARPDIKIVGGALSSLSFQNGRIWLRTAMQAGLLEFVDAVSVHPYNKDNPPEDDPHFGKQSRTATNDIEQAFLSFWSEVEAAKPKGKPLTLLLTETGYSSAASGPPGLASEIRQADFISRMMLIYLDLRVTRQVPIQAVYWYDLKDDGGDDGKLENKFGLVTDDLGRKKPAFLAYKSVIASFPSVGDLEPSPLKLSFSASNGKVLVKSWQRKSDGKQIIAFWRYDDSAQDEKKVNLSLRFPHPCEITPKFGQMVVAGEDVHAEFETREQKDGGQCETIINAQAGPRSRWVSVDFVKSAN